MGKVVFVVFFSALLALGADNVVAQSTRNERASDDLKMHHAERSMILKAIDVQDKSSKNVEVNGKEYPWFENKEEAIDYFKNLSVKSDLITVYIDSKQPLQGPNTISLIDEYKIIEARYDWK